jgi:hypothetical protein
MPALRLPDFDEVLPRHLERRLDRFGPPGDEVDVRHPRRRVRDQVIAQLLGDSGGKKAGVCVGESVDLPVHGGQHFGVTMAQARNGRAARGVDVFAARAVDEANAAAAGGQRRRRVQTAVHQMSHASARRAAGPQ